MEDETKSMTLRLPKKQAEELEAVARVDEVSMAQAVRSAIDAHIAARRADEAFRDRLKRALDENRDILERLAR